MSDYGDYFRREEIEKRCPGIVSEWDDWLDSQRDPGHYDAYKERDQSVLPYIDGKPQWVTDTFMPQHLIDKMNNMLAMLSGCAPS